VADLVNSYPAVKTNGRWIPSSTNYSYSDGSASTTVSGSGQFSYTAGNPNVGAQVVINVDLNSGLVTEYYTDIGLEPPYFNQAGVWCDDQTIADVSTITGSFDVQFVPVNLIQSLAFTNPFAAFVAVKSAVGSVDSTTAANAVSANSMAADGISAVVVVYTSNSASPVTFTLSATGNSGSLSTGTLSAYDPGYLSSAGPGTPLGSPVTPTCDSSGVCTALALLWPPKNMPVAASTAAFPTVTLTVSALQDGTTSASSLNLVPPPLLFIHGVWSSAQASWGIDPYSDAQMFGWIHGKYPHNMIDSVDYGGLSSYAFTDPDIMQRLEDYIAYAMTAGANGMAARSFDIVAHSMGGLVVRYFLDQGRVQDLPYLPPNPVHDFITVGTPHLGSALATSLYSNSNVVSPLSSDPTVGDLCFVLVQGPCTLANVFAAEGRSVTNGAVLSMEPTNPVLTGLQPRNYAAVGGQAPVSNGSLPGSWTETYLDFLINAFLPFQTVQSILGTTQHDTIVPLTSQLSGTGGAETINGIVHTALSSSDTGETASTAVWNQVLYWLQGGVGAAPAASRSLRWSSAVRNHSSDATYPILDLTGYTQVDGSNVTISPDSLSVLDPNATTPITAASTTKAITELLLFAIVSDPIDIPVLWSTASPFSISLTPGRLGSGQFLAVVLFSDMTYCQVSQQYTYESAQAPLSLALLNPPLATLDIGGTTPVAAQAGFPNGLINVANYATYQARSGTSSVFSVQAGGIITAIGNGVDWLDVSYSGQTASAPISVGACTFALAPSTQTVIFGGGSAMINVSTQSGCAWTANLTGGEWLTAATLVGTGSGAITLQANANITGSTQSASLTIGTASVTVVQPAVSCTYAVSPTVVTLPAAAGSGTITVTSNCPFTLASDSAWLTAVNLGTSVG
jgi:pimeloyl-ACP methyl ester carboxylesterase